MATLYPQPYRKTLLDMPLYLQEVGTSFCVPYSVLAIAHFFGLTVSKAEAIRACRTHKTQGSSCLDYVNGVRALGLKFGRLKFNFKNVAKCLNRRIPVVICYQTSSNESHFSTIISARKNERGLEFYLLNDTFYGRYEIPAELLVFLMAQDASWARTLKPL